MRFEPHIFIKQYLHAILFFTLLNTVCLLYTESFLSLGEDLSGVQIMEPFHRVTLHKVP